MTEIKVNTENMRTTANAFQDKIDEWKGLVNQLWSLTEELNGMWEGDANISFNEMVDAVRPRFDRLAGMMETYRQAIENAAAQYEDGEAEVKGIVSARA